MKERRIDAIETHPLIGMDSRLNIVTDYSKAEIMEQCEHDDKNIIAWGVYLHRTGEGIECVFDCPDEENAELARRLLEKLLNL